MAGSATAAEPVAAKRRKRRSSTEIVDRIVAAAGEEFKRSGYAGATTAAIARAADVTEAQIFRHFASKADLFRDAIFQPLNQHFAAFMESGAGGGTPSEGFDGLAKRYITELQDFMGEHSRMLMSLIVARAYEQGGGEGPSEIAGLNAYFDRGAAMMRGRVGDEPRVPPELMVRVSFAAVLACVMFRDWLFPKGMASEGAISQAIVDFVLDGIRANEE